MTTSLIMLPKDAIFSECRLRRVDSDAVALLAKLFCIDDEAAEYDLVDLSDINLPVDDLEKRLLVSPPTQSLAAQSDRGSGKRLAFVEGSPLKTEFLQFDFSESVEEEQSVPKIVRKLPVNPMDPCIARNLLFHLLNRFRTDWLASRKQDQNCRPLFICCSGCDVDSTVLLGTSLDGKWQKAHLAYCLGPYIDEKVPSLSELLDAHMIGNGSVVRQIGFARCDVTGSEDCNDASWLFVSAEWNAVRCTLQAPPINAKFVLNIKPGRGDLMSRSSPICKVFHEALQSGTVGWSPINFDEMEDCQQSTAELTKTLISDTKQALFVQDKRKLDDDQATSSEPRKNVSAMTTSIRVDLDFTEKLWKILMRCSCAAELMASLQLVMDSLRSGDIQPLVSQENNTRMANLIRDSFAGRFGHLRLESSYSLDLAIELGIEKIGRDFIEIFCGNDLITLIDLAPFLIRAGATCSDQILRLKKLANAYEILTICKNHLGINQQVQCSLLRHVVKYYVQSTANLDHRFVFPLSGTEFKHFLSRWKSHEWRAQMDYSFKIDGADFANLIFYFSREIPVHYALQSNSNGFDGSCGELYYLSVGKTSALSPLL